MLRSISLYALPAVLTALIGHSNARATARQAPSDDLALRAAAHVMYAWPGVTIPEELNQLVDAGKVGGIIIYKDNVDANTAQTMQGLQDRWSKSPVYNGAPLLIATDQEGGVVARLPGGPVESAKDIGSSPDPTGAAAQAGTTAANVLKQFHHNLNLAPIGDVWRVPGDFEDQFNRSFSNDPNLAGQCVASFVQAQQNAGVAAAVKHFPGLGSAAADANTDVTPVTLPTSLDDIRNIDYPPFKAAIEAGAGMIMASWAYYPALDPDFPAGLSSKWLKDELRTTLGFKGVTISDALPAGGLQNFGFDIGHRAVLAAQAGIDVILAGGGTMNMTEGSASVDALVNAVTDGTLDAAEFDAATERIMTLRKGLTA